MRFAVPAQTTSPPRDHQLRHRVAGARVEALDDRDPPDDGVRRAVRVAGDDEVDRRVLDRLGDAHDRALPGVRGPAVDPFAPSEAPSWITTICTFTPRLRSLADSRSMRCGLVEEDEPRGGVGAHELRRRPDRRADHADAHAVHAEHLRRLHPVRRVAGRLLDDVRRQEREVRPLLVLEDPLDAEVELVVAEARGVESPRVLDVDRRPVVEQRRVRRRGADVVTGREQQRAAGQRRSSPRRTSSRAAPHRRRRR